MKLAVFPNLGNTCYLNSVLQCFIHNKDFQELIKGYDLPFVTELQKITVDLTDNEEHFAHLFNITNLLSLLPFRRFEQQDAHECIISFLELLIKECPYKEQNISENNSWSKLNTSPCVPMYHGQTRNSIRCLKCKTIKHVFEEFNSITLSLNSEKSVLTDLFVKYLEKETYDDPQNLYYCETCVSNEKYEKKISLYKLPKIFIVVLGRYTNTGSKILSEVVFDTTLKIRESESGEIKEYTLTNTINHTGNLYNGHYTNYSIINNKCLFIDDHSVNMRPLSHEDAYILFYSS